MATHNTKIQLDGEDRASKAILDVDSAVNKTAKDLEKAAKASDSLASGSPGLDAKQKQFMMLGASVAGASSAMGAGSKAVMLFDTALQMSTGPMGIAIAVLTAAGMAYEAFSKSVEAAAKKSREAQIAKLDEIEGSNVLLAAHVGLTVDALENTQKTLTVEEARSRIRTVVLAIVTEEKAQLKAITDEDKEGAAAAERREQAQRGLLGGLQKQLDLARDIAATSRRDSLAVQELNAKAAATLDKGDAARLRLTALRRREEAIGLEALVASGKQIFNSVDAQEQQNSKTERRIQLLGIEAERLSILATFDKAASKPSARRSAGKKDTSSAEFDRQMADDARAAWEMSRDVANEAVRAQVAYGEAIEDSRRKLADARLAAITDPAVKAAAQVLNEQVNLEKDLKKIRLDTLEGGILLENRLTAARISAINTIRSLEVGEQKRKKKADDDDAIMEIGKQRRALGSAAAIAGALGQIEGARRIAAGFSAAISFAQAYLAYAEKDYQGAIAGAIAGAQFTAIAAGAGSHYTSSASSASLPSLSGAAGASGVGAQQSSGGQVINVNFSRGFIIGTEQDVGKAVDSAVRSLGPTGIQKAGGI